MKPPPPHGPLLDDVLTGTELEPLRAASLAQMLGTARRRRQQRQAWRTAAWVVVPALVAVGLLLQFFPARKPSEARHGVPGTAAVPAKEIKVSAAHAQTRPGSADVSRAPAGVKILTDAELLAFFPDRPVGIIGPPGRQKFVLLDGKP